MESDEIRIRELKVFAHHGVYEKEKQEGQDFFVNAVLFQDVYAAGCTDDLEKTTNYGEVCRFITDWMTTHTFQLIETVAEQLLLGLLQAFPKIKGAELEIRKPQAPIPFPFESVSVCIRRWWHLAYLSLGSNMGDSRKYLEKAIMELGEEKHTRVVKASSVIQTKPYGGVQQNDFLNAAVKIQTLLKPDALLSFLHEIEKRAGRERKIHWGPRTLDLDIIYYDNLIYENDALIIPHVDMENREFVLEPLNEIAPNLRHPILRKTVNQLLQELHNGKRGAI